MKNLNDSDRKLAEEFAARKYTETLNRVFELFKRIGEAYDPCATFRRNKNYDAKYRKNFRK